MQTAYQKITDKILAIMESGKIPWKKPWKFTEIDSLRNGTTGRSYTGANVLLLIMQAEEYFTPVYYTFKQIKDKKATLKKGSHGSLVNYWSRYNATQKREALPDDSREDEIFPVLRNYYVYNSADIEDLQPGKHGATEEEQQPQEPPEMKIDEAEALFTAYTTGNNITVTYNGDKAYYQQITDSITLPKRHNFTSTEGMYSTFFHEIAHSTGHMSRLNRDLTGSFGTAKYAREELIAELTAAMICGCLNISTDETEKNTAAYLQSWEKVLKEDVKLFPLALAAAAKAADFIRNTPAAPAAAAEPQPQEPTITGFQQLAFF